MSMVDKVPRKRRPFGDTSVIAAKAVPNITCGSGWRSRTLERHAHHRFEQRQLKAIRAIYCHFGHSVGPLWLARSACSDFFRFAAQKSRLNWLNEPDFIKRRR
jgi:hypothetical protein